MFSTTLFNNFTKSQSNSELQSTIETFCQKTKKTVSTRVSIRLLNRRVSSFQKDHKSTKTYQMFHVSLVDFGTKTIHLLLKEIRLIFRRTFDCQQTSQKFLAIHLSLNQALSLANSTSKMSQIRSILERLLRRKSYIHYS